MKALPAIAVIGPFPPPMHGAALATQSVATTLEATGQTVIRINTAGSSLSRALHTRLGRFPRTVRGMLRLGDVIIRESSVVYISLAGGLGQFSDELFSIMARISRNPLVLHHHSYAYLNNRRIFTWMVLRTAGPNATHLVQCEDMRDRLARYGISRGKIKIFSNIFAIQFNNCSLIV